MSLINVGDHEILSDKNSKSLDERHFMACCSIQWEKRGICQFHIRSFITLNVIMYLEVPDSPFQNSGSVKCKVICRYRYLYFRFDINYIINGDSGLLVRGEPSILTFKFYVLFQK